MKRAFLIGLVAACAMSRAFGEALPLCYAYGCNVQTEVRFGKKELKEVRQLFSAVKDADSEREVAARVVGLFYLLAGTQSPIWQDHGGNDDDEEVQGRMDCIDHSTNTTAFLALMERHGWLRFHRVGEPAQRGFWAAHWAARLIETGSGQEWVIDSWFFDPGEPAAIFPFDHWQRGAAPAGFKKAWQ